MAGKIGTVKVLCGLSPWQQVDLSRWEGREWFLPDGKVGILTNVRVEGNCVVADVQGAASRGDGR